jgi:hypothetical protein
VEVYTLALVAGPTQVLEVALIPVLVVVCTPVLEVALIRVRVVVCTPVLEVALIPVLVVVLIPVLAAVLTRVPVAAAIRDLVAIPTTRGTVPLLIVTNISSGHLCVARRRLRRGAVVIREGCRGRNSFEVETGMKQRR